MKKTFGFRFQKLDPPTLKLQALKYMIYSEIFLEVGRTGKWTLMDLALA